MNLMPSAPWTAADEDRIGGELNIVGSDGSVGFASTIHCGFLNAQRNAYLMAAAPDLYEALRELKLFVQEVVLNVYDETPALRARFDLADAALAKASGKVLANGVTAND